jgi:PiT family inorganic phosphate transporter
MFVSTLICLARAANDTPKLAAICLFGTGRPVWTFLLVMTAMLLGGSVFGKPVAITMSHRISKLDVSAALAASWATVFVTMPATFLGLPVSSTHVTAGAIAGGGTARRRLVEQTLREVLLAWFTTLPAAAGLAWVLGSVLLLVEN